MINSHELSEQDQKDSANSSSKVKVALRIRPLINKELIEGSLKCLECLPQTSQVIIGKDKCFNFDKIYDENSCQDEIYSTFVHDLVLGCFNGYNATVLAYGQTGSGKTYTMGSAMSLKPEDTGIISRVIQDIFSEIELRKSKADFVTKVSYLEIYNEEIYDLLDSTITSSARSKISKPNNAINIREEKDGSISIYGINEEKTFSCEEMLSCLERGSLHRSTASTLMNEVSSRSHAIFTIILEQHTLDDLYKTKTPTRGQGPTLAGAKQNEPSNGFMTAKFHFVDLAGSERIKKTGASGSVMKEGININRGLLVLGNVISALTECSSKLVHVPYRESKLTRILQDSLGGNSLTGMIACVSPAESNYEESLNTIKYANRARNIQNTPHINRDPQTALISQLKQQIFDLQNENCSLKQLLSSSDIKWEDRRNSAQMRQSISPYNQKTGLDLEQEDLRNLKLKLVQMERLTKKLQAESITKQKSLNELEISMYTIKKERDILRLYNEKYKEGRTDFSNEEYVDLETKQSILETYKGEIEKMKLEIQRKDEFTKELQIEYEHLLISSRKDQDLLLEKIRLLGFYKKHIEKLESQTPKDLEKDIQESEKLIQEPSEEDEEWLEMENELVSIKTSAENELDFMSGTLKEKEELLRNITENNMELERNLLDVMKNQYHQKISNLEGELNGLVAELKKIEGQRDKALSQLNHTQGDVKNKEFDDKNRLMVQNFKSKIAQLENHLKEFRKKEKEQQHLQKLVQNQQNKITDLASEIKTIKNQKLQLNKKYREEIEKLDKFKAVRNREKIDWKKKELEKEVQISRLKSEKERMNMLMKKKDEEIVNNKKSQELFRNLCNKDFKPFNNAINPFSDYNKSNGFLGARRYATRKTSKIIEEKDGIIADYDLTEDNIVMSINCLQQKVLEILELDQKILNEEYELRRTQEDLENELKKQSEFLLKKEKIVLHHEDIITDWEEEEAFKRQNQELDTQINEFNMRIENLEDKIEFLKRKLTEIRKKSQRSGGINDLFYQFLQIERSNYKGFLKGILDKWSDMIKEILKMKEEIKRKTLDLNEHHSKYSTLELKYNMAQANFQSSLLKLQEEYEAKNLKMLQRQDLYTVCFKESKDITPFNNDNKTNQRNDPMEIENNTNYNIIKTTPEIKLVSFKEKRQLVRQEKLKEKENLSLTLNNQINPLKKDLESLKPKSPLKKRELTELVASPENFEPEVKVTQIVTIQDKNNESLPLFNFFPEFKDFSTCQTSFFDIKQEDTLNFQCIYQYNGANSSINCLKAIDKILYIGSKNGIQILDLECNRLVNEWKLDSNESELKTLNINREKNLLVYSYDNYIELRDLSTHQKINSLKARNNEIKDICFQDSAMFVAGKGTISRGGLNIYDFRRNSWINEIEKNSDISKILIKDKILYYGGKEKIIKRMNIETGLNFYPYVQKHTDSIVSMTSLKNHIVSGSKDKTIKLWNANNFIDNCTDSIHYDKNIAMTLESSFCYSNVFYSGGIDGKFNIWGVNSEKIKKVYELEEAHQNSINAIVESSYNNFNFVITGSNDEMVKVWKPGEEVGRILSEMN